MRLNKSDDAFKLTIDEIFPPHAKLLKKDDKIILPEVYSVPGYSDSENMW